VRNVEGRQGCVALTAEGVNVRAELSHAPCSDVLTHACEIRFSLINSGDCLNAITYRDTYSDSSPLLISKGRVCT
jgi:hypothetical protein